MLKTSHKERLSIDVFPQQHRKIKIFAALQGKTIRQYVLECVLERVQQENEDKDLMNISSSLAQDSALKEVWDNNVDSAYDKL